MVVVPPALAPLLVPAESLPLVPELPSVELPALPDAPDVPEVSLVGGIGSPLEVVPPEDESELLLPLAPDASDAPDVPLVDGIRSPLDVVSSGDPLVAGIGKPDEVVSLDDPPEPLALVPEVLSEAVPDAALEPEADVPLLSGTALSPGLPRSMLYGRGPPGKPLPCTVPSLEVAPAEPVPLLPDVPLLPEFWVVALVSGELDVFCADEMV